MLILCGECKDRRRSRQCFRILDKEVSREKQVKPTASKKNTFKLDDANKKAKGGDQKNKKNVANEL